MRYKLIAVAGVLLASAAGQCQERGSAGPFSERRTRPGAEPQAVALVDEALGWLARHQEPDGRWSSAGWRGRCTAGAACAATSDAGVDGGMAGFDAGVTALSVLAFLGHGHTAHGGGGHAATIGSALAWLVSRQVTDGSIGLEPRGTFGDETHQHGEFRTRREGDKLIESFDSAPAPSGWGSYNHAVATIALCEAVAMGDERWRAEAGRALAFVVASQNPGLGWKYGQRSGMNDSSMTLWMGQALRAGVDAGLDVAPESIDGAHAWLVRATDSSGNTGYSFPGQDPPGFFLGGRRIRLGDAHSLSAGACFVRLLLGEEPGANGLLQMGQRVVAARPARDRKANPTPFMHLYYGASLLALLPRTSRTTEWRLLTRDVPVWRTEQLNLLAAAARRDGCALGSFEPTEVWCIAGGRVYATAIAALSLEAPWRLGGRRKAR